MATLRDLEKEIENIKQRNKRVELEKSWETSWTRKITIFTLTYIVIVIFFYYTGLPNPLLNSIVPAVAFVLSTLSIPIFKKMWLKRLYRKQAKLPFPHIKNKHKR
ncbi:MAG: hypothetical protein KKB03_03980 [Nanoarchaeota archaeon]|nr:hypothetical protein [Nanoarchaeota archaeon]MBU1135563.1 hypothetical protein [Nanoarchaeota archaeon]MBU2520372.1 hypothetical protein [Nanoarchaeota archaeon]